TSRQYIRRNGDAIARVVRSITDHWSIGSGLGGGYSEFRNTDLYQLAAISAAYTPFPWAEATSRQLVLATGIGLRRYEYASETIYGETAASW
ncbi:MAG: hypothetical protein ACKOH8_09680, partial [Gemmatimonadota bacterium]